VRARSWAASVLLVAATAAAAADRLAGYDADAARFTVSGVSSGGYLAVQLQVAHSSRVKGVAALAAGPYYCAQGSLWTATQACMSPAAWAPLPALTVLQTHTERLSRAGAIDRTSFLPGTRVWLFSGTRDEVVTPAVVDALRAFYAAYAGAVILVRDRPAGHAMVTDASGSACGATAPPFINDCDYDAAGELLRHLLGELAPPSAKPAGRVVAFDQRQFGDARAISMAEEGYAYVPLACDAERCRVHVALHGCRQGAEAVGERFVRDAGYNRWADTNRLIVLYPQAIARYWWPYNPRGCWDWWGYSGAKYATKEGAQIRAVVAIVDRLGEPRR
jgi:poly(3-hydroxybutyrate) depolymerase